MTAPRFELTSQRQKVSRLPTEPPGRLVCEVVRVQKSRLKVLVAVLLIIILVHSSKYIVFSITVKTNINSNTEHC